MTSWEKSARNQSQSMFRHVRRYWGKERKSSGSLTAAWPIVLQNNQENLPLGRKCFMKDGMILPLIILACSVNDKSDWAGSEIESWLDQVFTSLRISFTSEARIKQSVAKSYTSALSKCVQSNSISLKVFDFSTTFIFLHYVRHMFFRALTSGVENFTWGSRVSTCSFVTVKVLASNMKFTIYQLIWIFPEAVFPKIVSNKTNYFFEALYFYIPYYIFRRYKAFFLFKYVAIKQNFLCKKNFLLLVSVDWLCLSSTLLKTQRSIYLILTHLCVVSGISLFSVSFNEILHLKRKHSAIISLIIPRKPKFNFFFACSLLLSP